MTTLSARFCSMKFSIIALCCVVGSLVPITATPSHASPSCPQVDQVNSFIGTGGLAFGYGGVNPGAQYPHGPLRLGPDTTNALPDVGYRHFSGYNYLDNKVRMFSHTHFVGAGINGLGNLGTMPVRLVSTEEEDGGRSLSMQKWVYGRDKAGQKHEDPFNTLAWWSTFSKERESAAPGRYQVHLDTPAADVTLLATGTLTAAHQYHFSGESSGYEPAVVVDVCHAAQLAPGVTPLRSSDCQQASFNLAEDKQSFTASLLGDKDIWMHFYGQFTSAGGNALTASEWTVCSNADTATASGDDSAPEFSCTLNPSGGSSDNGILFTRVSFGTVDGVGSLVELRVGLSFISAEQAKSNYHADFPPSEEGKDDFEELAVETSEQWCAALDFLTVTPLEGDEELAAMLYSASYRAQLTPSVYTEAGGLYLGLDKQVHNGTQERQDKYGSDEESSGDEKVMQFYSDLSLWDTFRSAHPWQLLTDEPLAVGVLRSLCEMTEQQDAFPRWVLASTDISCMVGLHGGALAVEAAESGLGKNFDLLALQQMLQRMATEDWSKNGRTDLDFYLREGYVSSEANDHSASLSVTYAFDDFLLSRLSTLVDDSGSEASATQRAQNYRHSWSAEKEFMCPRSETGAFQCPTTGSSLDSWQDYIEGDGLHWSYFVGPQDPQGLIALSNSTERFTQQLELFFTEHVKYTEKLGEAVPNPYFWQGNEVDHFAVWLFNYTPQCALSQRWSRTLTHMHFSNTPHGIPGNEDYGAMSTWLLFASLGLFPRAGTTSFEIGSPRVREAFVRLQHLGGESSLLEITTVNNSAENVYVSAVLLNGQPYHSTHVDRSVLAASGGCRLQFTMSPSPESSLC